MIAGIVLAGAAGSGGSIVASSSSALAEPLPPRASVLWRGAGVVHARFVDAFGSVVGEEWLNRASGDGRRVEYERTSTGTVARTVVREGLTFARWTGPDPRRKYLYQAVDRDDAQLVQTSELTRASRMYDRRTARIESSGTVDTEPTWRVRIDKLGSHAPPDSELVVDVRKRDFLPLRYLSRSGRDESVLNIQLADVDPATLPAGFFSVDRSEWAFRDRRLRYSSIARSVTFRAYALGAAYLGLCALPATLHDQRTRERTDTELFVGYARPGTETLAIQLTQQRAGTNDANARLAVYRSQGDAYRVSIRGSKRRVYVLRGDRERTFFATVVGGTLVKGYARLSRSRTLALLPDLRPVEVRSSHTNRC